MATLAASPWASVTFIQHSLQTSEHYNIFIFHILEISCFEGGGDPWLEFGGRERSSGSPRGAPRGARGQQLWGGAGGVGTLRALPAPFLTCTLSTASHLGSLSPSGSFGKGSHGKETLCEGLTHGSAEPGHKIRERQRGERSQSCFPPAPAPNPRAPGGSAARAT